MEYQKETYENFVNHYNSLEWKEKVKLLEKIINIKTNNNESDKSDIKEIDLLFSYLIQKISTKKLTEQENELFLGISSRYLINNIKIDDNIINDYVCNYLSNNRQYKPEEIIIYLNYFRCYFNNFFNKKITFNFKNRMHTDYEFGIPINPKIEQMMVNVCIFKKLLDKQELDKQRYFHHLVIIAFLIIHEYIHILQKDYIDKNYYNEKSAENYIIESLIMKIDKQFYQKYHDYFNMEYDADEYAIMYVPYFLNGIVPNEDIKCYLEWIENEKMKYYDDNSKQIVEEKKVLFKSKYYNS